MATSTPLGSVVSPFAQSNNSFSGVDIKAVFGSVVIGTLQAISYSVTREKAPIYTMGSADPRSFSRGKRGIAGTLIFIVFDRHSLLHAMKGVKFLSDKDDVRPNFRTAETFPQGAFLSSLATKTSDGSTVVPGATVDEQESPVTTVAEDQETANPWYVDQIPPFDITLACANEYGALAVMKIMGVEILNEGTGVSIDDIVTEQTMTYVARQVLPLTYVDSKFVDEIASSGA